MTAENSARGRSNRNRGIETEKRLARWLKAWYPAACRAVRNTYPDPGDIAETHPGLYWSVKYTAREEIPKWMAEVQAKRGDRLGLLVVRRGGHADPGQWWCWLRLGDLLVELAEPPNPAFWVSLGIPSDALVRLELRHVTPLLAATGYTPTPQAAT